MLPKTPFITSATQAWTSKKSTDAAEADKVIENQGIEAAAMLTALMPDAKCVVSGSVAKIEGLEFIADYDTVTGYHAKKVLWLLQFCPKCGAVERYRIEFLWNIGQVVQENYIGTRHVCVVKPVIPDLFTEAKP